MAEHISLARLWQDAVEEAGFDRRRGGKPPLVLLEACPFSLEELLEKRLDLSAAVARIQG